MPPFSTIVRRCAQPRIAVSVHSFLLVVLEGAFGASSITACKAIIGARIGRYCSRMTTREKLHRLVDELTEAEAHAALTRLERERAAIERWAEADDAGSVTEAWAVANAREAIREEPW